MFVLVAFLLFSSALFGVAYYVWIVPQQEAARILDARLRGVRSSLRSGKERGASDLMRTVQRRGTFAFLGDFVEWLGLVRRLQVYIVQANLTYRAADVAGICIAIAVIFVSDL